MKADCHASAALFYKLSPDSGNCRSSGGDRAARRREEACWRLAEQQKEGLKKKKNNAQVQQRGLSADNPMLPHQLSRFEAIISKDQAAVFLLNFAFLPLS